MPVIQNVTLFNEKKHLLCLSFYFVPLYQNQQEYRMHPREVKIWTMTFFRPHTE